MRLSYRLLWLGILLAVASCTQRSGAPSRDVPSSEVWRIYKAIDDGDMVGLTALLDSGVSPDFHSRERGYLVSAARQNRNVELVLLLIRRGANVNVASEESGATPLLMSVVVGDCQMTKIFLAAGADREFKFAHPGAIAAAELTGLNAVQIYERNVLPFPDEIARDPECWSEVGKMLTLPAASKKRELW